MNNSEEHKFRLQYLDVLMKHGIPLETASKYFDNVMKFDEIKETARKAEIFKALESTQTSDSTEDFTEEDRKFFMESAGLAEKEPVKRQTEFDFVGSQKKRLFPRADDYVEDIKKDLTSFNSEIPMVNPQEKFSNKMGDVDEQVPLRYEDRIKQAQR